jgi:hypothetical protein
VLSNLSKFYRRPGNGYDVRDPDVVEIDGVFTYWINVIRRKFDPRSRYNSWSSGVLGPVLYGTFLSANKISRNAVVGGTDGCESISVLVSE